MADYEKWELDHLRKEAVRRKIPRFEGDNRVRLITLLKLDDEHRRQLAWILALGFFNALGWGLLWGMSPSDLTLSDIGLVAFAVLLTNAAALLQAAWSLERSNKLKESAASDST